MRFKEWFLKSEAIGGAATSIMHGGIQDLPTSRLNINLPVQSKISCKDGSDKVPPDAADAKRRPDDVFGFRSPEDRNRAKERASQWIDMNRRRVGRFVTVPPDTIY